MNSRGTLTALVSLIFGMAVLTLIGASWLWYRVYLIDKMILITAPSFILSSTTALLMIRQDRRSKARTSLQSRRRGGQTLIDILRKVKM